MHFGNGMSPLLSRRDALQALGAAGAGLAFSGCAHEAGRFTRARRDVIRRENSRPGTRDWLLTKV